MQDTPGGALLKSSCLIPLTISAAAPHPQRNCGPIPRWCGEAAGVDLRSHTECLTRLPASPWVYSLSCHPRFIGGTRRLGELLGVAGRLSETVLPFRAEQGTSLETPSRARALSLFTFMHWRRKWQPTPVFLPGESQGRGSLVGCRLWGRTELDTTEVT